MRLIDLEGDTNFTLQNQSAVKGQKLGLCLQSLIFLSLRRVSPFLAWGNFHARSRFARSTIPEEKWGTTRSLAITYLPNSSSTNQNAALIIEHQLDFTNEYYMTVNTFKFSTDESERRGLINIKFILQKSNTATILEQNVTVKVY